MNDDGFDRESDAYHEYVTVTRDSEPVPGRRTGGRRSGGPGGFTLFLGLLGLCFLYWFFTAGIDWILSLFN